MRGTSELGTANRYDQASSGIWSNEEQEFGNGLSYFRKAKTAFDSAEKQAGKLSTEYSERKNYQILSI